MNVPAGLPDDLAAFLADLTDAEIEQLGPERRAQIVALIDQVLPPCIEAWKRKARPEQIPPDDFYVFLAAGGRGSGKSTACTYWLAECLLGDGPGDESAIVAPTFSDAIHTNIEGPAGLLASLGTSLGEVNAGQSEYVERYNRSRGEVFMRNGGLVLVDGATDGGLRLQGHNFRRAFCDEVQLWPTGAAETTWDESLLPAVRLGRPQIVAAMTPKATPLVRRLLKDPRAVVRRMTTFDNAANLAPEFIAEMIDRYEGTRMGRTQLYGELIEDTEGTYGDKPLAQLLDQAMRQLGVTRPYKVVKPSTSKTVRAIPVAALSEQDRLKIVGSQPALEEQMTTWTGAKGERSPNELDAMVHAATELMTYARRAYPGDSDNDGAVPYTDQSFGEDGAVPWADADPNTGRGTFAWFERRHGL